jgi:hypothetical protein
LTSQQEAGSEWGVRLAAAALISGSSFPITTASCRRLEMLQNPCSPEDPEYVSFIARTCRLALAFAVDELSFASQWI